MIPEFWPQVSLVESQLMPDHFHGVLFVEEALPKGKSLGSIIGGFKAGCTKGWASLNAPSQSGVEDSALSRQGPDKWVPGYVDTILFGKGQLERMVAYLRDNPRRLGVKREHPELFKVTRELDVPGVGRFSAIGNHFLLSRHAVGHTSLPRRPYLAWMRWC